MGDKSPAFQFYPADWLSSPKIAQMTPEQEGAYIRLLCYAWADPDCSIPDDDEVLARLSRMGEGWLNGGSCLVRACFSKNGNRLSNDRLKLERKKQDEWHEKSRAAGVLSGKARREKGYSLKVGCNLVGTKREPNTNQTRTLPLPLPLPPKEEIHVPLESRKPQIRKGPDHDLARVTALPEPGGVSGLSPEDWEAIIESYPGKTQPDNDARLYVSLVCGHHEKFRDNLAAWKASGQWQRGYTESLGKFIESGQWKRRPPPDIVPDPMSLDLRNASEADRKAILKTRAIKRAIDRSRGLPPLPGEENEPIWEEQASNDQPR
ncbi:MAG TPA: DUF1376 domain-containing protein [Terriglobia bacterium]|nr:DUF1376 domain-containing protein [Terriglobia bacterium]